MPTRKKFQFFPMRNCSESSPDYNPESRSLPPEVLDTDFKKKYPPDMFDQELHDNARVWKVYRDEAIQYDDGMLQAWNTTINFLLTFSGLFSAAVTAFVVESYQFLQTGSVVSGSASNPLPVNGSGTITSSTATPAHQATTALFINGLWFTSLFLSLAAAFLCILVKQWLDEYTVRTRASSQNPKHWSRRRAFYFGGLADWGVAGIISILPVLLHAALFLFFAGMVVLLWSLSTALAAWLSAIGGTLLILYGTSLCLPLWNDACPFAIPLVNHLRRSWISFRLSLLRSMVNLVKTARIQGFLRSIYSCCTDVPLRDDVLLTFPRYNYNRKVGELQDLLDKPLFDQVLYKVTPGEAEDTGELPKPHLADRLDCDVLCWLILFVSDSDANAAGFQALGAVTPCSPLASLLRPRGLRSTYRTNWLTGTGRHSATESARIVRSTLALGQPDLSPTTPAIRTIDACRWAGPQFRLLHCGLTARHQIRPWDPEVALNRDWYRYVREFCMPLSQGNNGLDLQSTALHFATLEFTHPELILLYLCLCDLTRFSRAQWAHILPAIRRDGDSCPHHAGMAMAFEFACILEALLVRVVAGDATVDDTVVRRLLDRLCTSYVIFESLHTSSTWVSYVTSSAFQPREHSVHALHFLLVHLDVKSNWTQTRAPDIRWLELWRRITHFVLIKGGPSSSPGNLITFMLSNPTGTPPVLCYSVLRAILSDGRRPSIWRMISLGDKFAPDYLQYLRIAQVLASTLCSIRRSGCNDVLAQFNDCFFASLDLPQVISGMEDSLEFVPLLFTPGLYAEMDDEAYKELQQRPVHFIAHILELRPSWLISVTNRLEHCDERKSERRAFALSIIKQAIQSGPCRACSSAAPPETFGVWVHDLDDGRSGFLSNHENRDTALAELAAHAGEPIYDHPRYDFGTLEDWKSDDEEEDDGNSI